MKKFLLTICMALPTLFVLGQSPGGVASPAAWYRADASVFSDAGTTSAANNATVYQWNDYLGTGRNLVQTTAARRPVYSNATTLANFNPTVTFTRANTHWMQCDPGTGNEIINRASGSFYTAGFMDSNFLGTSSGSGLIGFNDDMDNPGLHTSNNSQFNLLMYSENVFNYTPISTNAFTYKNSFVAGSSWQNGASTTDPTNYGATTISLNGVNTFYSGNNFRNVNISNSWRAFRIGGDTDFGSHNGQLNEILIYQNILTAQERNRLESYLAIKYGTTLSGNYLNSTNGIVWNSDPLYQNNVFGIARDNNGALHQKQSRSENKDQKLIIGNGVGLFNTNAANTNSLSDGQFLIVGDNGLKQALNNPLVSTGGANGETNYRFEAVWKVQNTGLTGNVTIAWPKGIANLYFVQSPDAVFDNTDAFTPMVTEVTVNGVVYNTATVNLTNGEFFTFAGYEFAPGGVTAAAWYRADGSGNLFSDAGTTTAADNAAIQQWNEFNNKPFPLSQSTATLRPVFSNATTLVNFNPTVNYTTSSKWMQYDGNALGNIIDRSTGALFSAGNTTGTTAFFGFGESGSNNTMDDPGLYNFTGNKFLFYPVINEYDPQSTYTINGSYIGGGTWQNGAGVSGNNAVDITLNGYHQTYNTSINNVTMAAGRNALMAGGAETSVAFQQNEMIVFPSKLTDQETNKVESYLAIKYGQTLSKEQNRNYLSSTATVVWDGSANNSYYNNVFGIARDNISSLYQKQSKSVNANQKLVIGAGNSLANTNAANTNTLAEGQFLMVGDNGLKQSLSTALLNPTAPGGETNIRFESIWKVQNTGTVGQVIVAWPKGVSNLHLVQSSNEIFDNTDTFTSMAAEVTINGVVYNTATVNFTNGEFFTFAGYEFAPGGVTAAAWYRADGSGNLFSDAGTTVAADNATIQQWNEFNNRPFPLSQSTATYRPQFSSTTTLVNFNPTVSYDGTQKWLQYAPADATGYILDRSKGALFSAGNTTSASSSLFGFGVAGSGNAMDDPGLYSFTGNKFLFYPVINEYDPQSTYTINGPYIGGGTWENAAGTAGNNAVNITLDGFHQTYNTNISNVNTAVARNALMVGKADAGAQLTGQQNEMIIFANKLTDGEVNKVESYLAIKYGKTLSKEQNRNYLSSTATVVWDGSANNSYYNNVFGIARDNISSLYQKQSKSVNANQKLVIGAGNSLANTNAANTNTLAEGQFLMVGDNGLKQSLSTTLLNSTAPGGETNIRFESIWKVQNTGTVGQVIVAWPKGVSNLHLVQSSNEIFDNTDTFTSMAAEVTINGVVYNTATVNLSNGQFFTFAGFAHAPGGVAGPDFWVKSDDAGDLSTAWKDHSLNEDNIPAVGTWTLSPADKLHNFHPYTTGYTGSRYFNNLTSVLNPTNGQLDNISHSIFSAVRPTSAGTGRIVGIDNDSNGAEPGFSIQTGKLRLYKFSGEDNADQFEEQPFNIGAANIVSGIGNNPVVAGGTSTSVGGERVLGVNGIYKTYPSTVSTNRFHIQGQRLRIGDGDWTAPGPFPGDIMEVVWYKRPLTANEQSRVNSYLALKNGATLAEDYLASNSNVVWNRANNNNYNNNIFGIARDNISALHQKQSASTNVNQKLVIGNNSTLFSTNADNTNDLTEGQFLIVGDNGLKQGLSTPLAYTGTNGEVNFRFESIWKTQKTSGVGTVTVAWPKGIQNFYLVQSTDELFTGGDTFTPMTTEVTVNGVVYNTATVTLGNGEFFTFAGFGHAPGGVINSLSYWYRADKDAANTGAGTDVTSWTDYFSGTVVSQISTAGLPKYVEGAANYFNFNSGLNFTGGTQKLGNINVQTLSALNYDIFTFTKEGMASGGTRSRFFNVGRNNTTMGSDNWDSPGFLINGNIVRRTNAGGDITEFDVNPKFSITIPSISYHTFTDLNFSRGLNGNLNGAALSHSSRGIMTGGHIFGANSGVVTSGDDDGFIGHLGETIIYGAGNLSAVERRRVDSYMAIKYGITLARVATDHYLGSTASATSIVWSGTLNAAYNNNIFGIARADIGGFEQKVSKSVNSGTILTIAKNNDFVSSNLAASRTGLPVDEGYLLLGDNNNTSTVPYTPTEIGNCGEIIGATEQIKLIPRKWLVQRTSSVGGTYLQANLAAYTADLNTEIKMYVADDENFTQNVVAIAGTQSGNNWVFPYNFDNDNTARYITFGGKFVAAPCEQCKGGTYTLRTGYQWNQGAWTNQTVNNKENILLGNDADGNPLYASMYADYSANPSIEYVPTRYPRQYAGRWTIARRYDNTNAQVQHRIELTKAMKASFQISNINTYRNNKNNFQVIGYCNGVAVMPKITYAYNTSYHTFDITGNNAVGTMSWRGFVPNVSTANVRFDRPVEQIVIISTVDRANTAKTLRSELYSDITLECAEVVPPTPDNVYVSHSYTQETLATCGGNTTMRIKVTNNNICDNKTISLHQTLPSGLVYVPGSFNGNDLPAGAMTGATLTYTGGNLNLSGLSLPSGEHWMYVDVANPGVAGTYPTQFTYEVTNGINPTNTLSSPVVNLNYYQSAAPVQSAPALTLSIKNNVTCGTNNMVMTYRMKIDNPNTTSITGAEILHMFDHDQIIQSVTYVTGEDEDGVITGTYPVDGAGATIDPINNNLFNLIDAEIPVGVSYIDITVNTGNSYNTPDVQAQGISSTFLVGIGSGECAESGETVSNEVVLPMCTTSTVCYKPGIVATAGNPALPTKAGITSLNRAGAQDADNWPMVRTGGWLALESKTKGFVPNRVAFSGGNPVGIPAADFREGMMVYDTTNKCLKIFTSVNNGSTFEWHCVTTQTCPD
ncbi:hypothetical protein ACFQO9_05015 [Chryseobacterium zhengzhouense]|uniref:DUF8202 domain-containing protein n=1 Tax=Chryseobacterium zhengzhouense TaxID=1636086 RepID=A0ABW2LU44_9FLAO